MLCDVWVPGKPATAGSKRAFPFKKSGGGLGVRVTHDNPRAIAWMDFVASHVREVVGGPIEGPIRLELEFHLLRPKGHYRSGSRSAEVKPTAPSDHITKPDLTKLVRAVEDGLKGVLWYDDSQVVQQRCGKRYGDEEGVQIVAMCLKTGG